MRQIESSLKRLQTDHPDQLMIHDVQSMADPEILRSFKPLPRERMEVLAQELTPF